MAPGEQFSTELGVDGDTVVVTIAGELDMATAPGLRDTFAALLASRPKRVVVDTAALSFVDSSGLAVLIAAERRTRDQGGELRLRNVTEATQRLLELAGVAGLLQVED